jgi:hypothetical protein
MVVGTIDLGLGMYYAHVLSEAARQGARVASVHGANALSSWNGGAWGPSTYTGTADSTDYHAQAIAAYLPGMDKSQVNITMSWPDGSNAVEKRVTVDLRATWTPVVGSVFGIPSVNLGAGSTMLIAH